MDGGGGGAPDDTWDGRYRRVGERFIQMHLEPLDPTLSRGLNFDYMNQVLAWQTLQHVLASLRPIVAYNVPLVASGAGTCRSRLLDVYYMLARVWRQRVSGAAPWKRASNFSSAPSSLCDAPPRRLSEGHVSQSSKVDQTMGARGGTHKPAQQPHEREEAAAEGCSTEQRGPSCVMCCATPANSAHVSGCLHVFCYLCLRRAQAEARGHVARCGACGCALKEVRRLELEMVLHNLLPAPPQTTQPLATLSQ